MRPWLGLLMPELTLFSLAVRDLVHVLLLTISQMKRWFRPSDMHILLGKRYI
jgi:hypothetical protein